MLISVIVVAYNRREFLKQAVDSVLNQTLPRDKYEVIVSKNFATEFDQEWQSKGVKLVRFEGAKYGERIAAALPHCSGGVICFLEDDDVFAQDKLLYVKQVFTRYPDATYLHHLWKGIDASGSEISEEPKFREFQRQIILDAPQPQELRRIPYGVYGFNSSSTVVSRLLLERSAYLSGVRSNWDHALWVASIALGGKIVLVPERLTYYRVHLSTSKVAARSVDEFVIKWQNLYGRRAADDRQLLLGTKGTPAEDIANWSLCDNMLRYLLFQNPQLSGLKLYWIARKLGSVLLSKGTRDPKALIRDRMLPASLLGLVAPATLKRRLFQSA